MQILHWCFIHVVQIYQMQKKDEEQNKKDKFIKNRNWKFTKIKQNKELKYTTQIDMKTAANEKETEQHWMNIILT